MGSAHNSDADLACESQCDVGVTKTLHKLYHKVLDKRELLTAQRTTYGQNNESKVDLDVGVVVDILVSFYHF